jgi:hypothetical protein
MMWVMDGDAMQVDDDTFDVDGGGGENQSE